MSKNIKVICKANVAEVTSENEIAFNAGSLAGVQAGDDIVLRRVVQVLDPVTKEFLGSVLYPKVRFKVSWTREKMCLGIVTDRYTPPSALIGSLSVRRLIKVTVDPKREADDCVLVRIGDEADVTRPDPPIKVAVIN